MLFSGFRVPFGTDSPSWGLGGLGYRVECLWTQRSEPTSVRPFCWSWVTFTFCSRNPDLLCTRGCISSALQRKRRESNRKALYFTRL